MSFPKGFLWGGSISAAQIEGGWNEGGKSPVLVDYCTAGSTTERRQIWYLDENGQRINIDINFQKNGKEITFISGWMVRPKGAITCNIPLGG